MEKCYKETHNNIELVYERADNINQWVSIPFIHMKGKYNSIGILPCLNQNSDLLKA